MHQNVASTPEVAGSGRIGIVPQYITIPKHEFQSLLKEVKRGTEVCTSVGELRTKLRALEVKLAGNVGKDVLDVISQTVDACQEVNGLRIELAALERRLREFDQDLTPIRPPSRTDMQAAHDAQEAFANATELASGKKKPGDGRY